MSDPIKEIERLMQAEESMRRGDHISHIEYTGDDAISRIAAELRAYPQISNCGIIATEGGGKNGEKELQVMDNIRCVLGGRKG